MALECKDFENEMTEVDRLLEDYEGEKALSVLEGLEERVGEQSWAEFAHRFAQANYIVYNQMSSGTAKERQQLLKKGLAAVEKAHNLDKTHLAVLTQCAVLTGTLAEASSVGDRARLGYQFKVYLDAALAQAPDDFSLLHMRGRFLFHLSELSWLEKKAASVLFVKLPEASYDLALVDLLNAHRKVPLAIDNLLYIAKCYLGKKDKGEARNYLETLVNLEAIDATDEEQIAEGREMLNKLG
ncbi:unnamed protein product, partial [Mesorhabditis spiculigera]